MNNVRRKELDNIIEELELLKQKIEFIMDDEQECFDNLSEGLQQSMRGQQMEEAVANLSLAVDSIDEVVSFIEGATI